MIWYRFSLKTGIRRLYFPQKEPISGSFYTKCEPVDDYPEKWKQALKSKADNICRGTLEYFFYHQKQAGNPPAWFANPFNNTKLSDPNKHWTKLSDFDLNTGDIKIIWEPSRFSWLTDLTRAYRVFGDEKYLNTINAWLQDWIYHNPLNTGPNWKCGQEASIRVMQLLTTAYLLNQWHQPQKSLIELIAQHIERIKGNYLYAMAQNNNHGTSEAAAMYIGGAWLREVSDNISYSKLGEATNKIGYKWLVNRIYKLIGKDGSFAQQSVNYHRMVLDTLSWVRFGQERLDLKIFVNEIQYRITAAHKWLEDMVDPFTGSAPNLGANDGAMLMNLHNSDYRDFRPSLLLCAVLHNGNVSSINEKGSNYEPLYWLNASYPQQNISKSKNQVYVRVRDNQYAFIGNDKARGILKLPTDKFRPANNALHFDLWVEGENLLRNTGSYSYNSKESGYFKSVKSQNTVQFDELEQMPRFSRFLNAEWFPLEKIEQKDSSIIASYVNSYANRHIRSIEWQSSCCVVTDYCESKQKDITIRWHLTPDKWELTGNSLKGTVADIVLNGHESFYLDMGWESLYYLQKKQIPVLCIKTIPKTEIQTKIYFN